MVTRPTVRTPDSLGVLAVELLKHLDIFKTFISTPTWNRNLQKYIFVLFLKAGEKTWVFPSSQLNFTFPFPSMSTFSRRTLKGDDNTSGIEGSGNVSLLH